MGAPQPCLRPLATPRTPDVLRGTGGAWASSRRQTWLQQSIKGFSRRLSRGSPQRSFPEAVWGLMSQDLETRGAAEGPGQLPPQVGAQTA